MNPKQMQKMMKQMGVEQQDIPDAVRVEITCADRKIIVEPCGVAQVNMMGQQTLQVTGDMQVVALETKAEISDDDIETVAGQTGVSKEQARDAIEKADGDLAQAIMDLSQHE